VLAQWVYFATLSHPQLSHTGVVGYAPGRYTRLAASLVPGGRPVALKAVEQAVAELEEARFVMVDQGTAELWVRSLVRRDGILSQPNMVKSMMREFSAILSAPIRRAIVEALGEGFLEGLAEDFPKVFPQPIRVVIPKPFLEAYREAFPEPTGTAHARGGGRGGAGAPFPPPPPPPPPTSGVKPPAEATTNGTAHVGNPDLEASKTGPPPHPEPPEPGEHPMLRPLAERMAEGLWPDRRRMVGESLVVVRQCLAVADPGVVDECIGRMLTADAKPHTPKYLLTAVRNQLVSAGAYAAADPAMAELVGAKA
jgi:hypothetical protein